MAHQIAQPQPGQPEGFRERPQQQHVRVAVQQRPGPYPVDKLHVCLIDQHQTGRCRHHRLDVLRGHGQPCRIVRRGQNHQWRPMPTHGLQQPFDVEVQVRARCHGMDAAAVQPHNHFIERKHGPGQHHGRALFDHGQPHREGQLVRAVAHDDALRGPVQVLGQRLPQPFRVFGRIPIERQGKKRL